eukprot:NODE_979_length_2616_cov_0.307906.p1 type:complete len:322 gc:universal NODE_979_length_2616_cov_0.307906:841-1806(+)
MTKITQWASSATGEFKRQVSSFRNNIQKGTEFEPELNRYHLIVSYACPWASRTLMIRKLKKLEDVISFSVVHYHLGEKGWRFATSINECSGVTFDEKRPYLSDYYYASVPEYQARFTVPVLYDKKLDKIVNNESSDIVRILDSAFNDFSSVAALTFYPETLRTKIDAVNEWVYDMINNGVYKAGFASKQSVYETNCARVFEGLDKAESILLNQDFLLGNTITEADIRLFVTVIRFDPVYFGHFKCNVKTIQHGYPNILKWMIRIYQIPGIDSTVNMHHIKHHYYESHVQINPTGIVPLGNGPDLNVFMDPLKECNYTFNKQ